MESKKIMLEPRHENEESQTFSKFQSFNTTEKRFQLQNLQIQYFNKCWIIDLPTNPKNQEVLIENFICQQFGDNLKKKTRIQIGSKLVIIEDFYGLTQIKDLAKTSFQLETATNQSFKNKSEESDQEKNKVEMKRDRKNIVKNIIKSYQCWIRKLLQSAQNTNFEQCKKCLEQLIHKTKFNNQLIAQIVNHPLLCSNLQYYLQSEAINWLQNSKIKDKLSHREAIEIYMKACRTGQFDDNVKNNNRT